MVSLTSFALLSLAAVGSLAGPLNKRSPCMSTADAQQVADNYAALISNFSVAGANAALSPDFTDYAEGVNTLINTCPQGSAAITLPLLAPSFTNRKQFEVGQGQQPSINVNQLGIWNTCNTVIMRWETTNTAPIPNPRTVVGIIIMEAEKSSSPHQYPWIIKEVFSEFDSGAWLQNLEEAGICSQAANPSSPPISISPASATSVPASASAIPSSTPAASGSGSPASYSAVPTASA